MNGGKGKRNCAKGEIPLRGREGGREEEEKGGKKVTRKRNLKIARARVVKSGHHNLTLANKQMTLLRKVNEPQERHYRLGEGVKAVQIYPVRLEEGGGLKQGRGERISFLCVHSCPLPLLLFPLLPWVCRGGGGKKEKPSLLMNDGCGRGVSHKWKEEEEEGQEEEEELCIETDWLSRSWNIIDGASMGTSSEKNDNRHFAEFMLSP